MSWASVVIALVEFMPFGRKTFRRTARAYGIDYTCERSWVPRLLVPLATVLEVDGWETWQHQTGDGAVESQQRVVLHEPVVEFTRAGAEYLGLAYWREVERVTRGLIRQRERNGVLELRLLGRGPSLLRFGRPTIQATSTLVCCSYPIEGGLLARRPVGEIAFAQVGGSPPVVRSTIRGFFPTLAARQGERDWTGALYSQVQSRVHVAISRRYFARLIREARR